MAVDLPSGTVTFLFTDIEDSTRRWEQEPEAMSAALARHDVLLRQAVAASRGVVFSTGGDSMAVVFGRAGDAIAAAVAAQRAFESERWPTVLRVRMGVHTGEAEERDGDYFGPAVNRAARLMSAAAGGQVLVSLSAAEVVRDRLPEGLSLVELGVRSLRSLSRPERVFELTWSAGAKPVTVAVQVLGPLRLVVGSVEVDVPGPKRRALLALLAMASPSPVSVDSLIASVWPEAPGVSDRTALQSHVSRVRRHLGPAASRLEKTAAGYRLRLDAGELDATHANELIEQARRIASADPTAARELVREARRLWRGQPLAEFADVESLVAWARSLDEVRIAGADLHAQLALDIGDWADALAVSSATVAEGELRESSTLLLMRALAGAGRAAEALRAGHTFREELAERTGLQPSLAMAALEHTIAAGQPEPESNGRAASPPPSEAVPRSVLVGRDAELAGIVRLVQSEPLVSLVGPGGVGKTTLAMETARRDRTGREVTVVRLSAVTEASALTDALAAALGLTGNIGDPLIALVGLLRSRPWLLVLDNCEHLLAEVREVVAALMSGCQELTILATSRERLGLPVEQICRVAPLLLPGPDQRDDLAGVPSVALFLERARRVRPGFQTDDTQTAVIAAMVCRLDGMPLAIELAAGRLSSLSLTDLSRRLDRALDVLAGASGVDQRHGTLRAAIEWSYELLPDDEKRLFRALAVFPDGFDLTAAEDVAREVAPATDPTTAVAHLVDASMLVATFDDAPRYRMLETLRSYGVDRLVALDELDAATERLLKWGVRLAGWIGTAIVTDEEPAAAACLLAELGNLRTVWSTARATGNLDVAATLVVSLWWTASLRDIPEFWNWTTELATDPRICEHADGASVFAVASEAAHQHGRLDESEFLARRGLEIAGDHDSPGRTRCLLQLTSLDLYRGRFADARGGYLEAVDDVTFETFGRNSAALCAAYAGDFADARRLIEPPPAGNSSPTAAAFHHYAEAEIDNLAGEWASAEQHYRKAKALAETVGATFILGVASVGLVAVQAASGQLHDALEGYVELIDYWERTGAWTQQWTTLRNAADLFDQLGDRKLASFLRSAADEAPEAASLAGLTTKATGGSRDLDMAEAFDTHHDARTREEVLDVARRALARWLTTTQQD